MTERKREWIYWGGVAFFAALTILMLLSLKGVKAQEQQLGDYGFGHHTFHHFYDTGEGGGPIMRPYAPGTKCCDGDCRPVRAKLVRNTWHVFIDGIWVMVPENRIKVGITPPEKPFRTAHVCAAKYNGKDVPEIYCFIPVDVDG